MQITNNHVNTKAITTLTQAVSYMQDYMISVSRDFTYGEKLNSMLCYNPADPTVVYQYCINTDIVIVYDETEYLPQLLEREDWEDETSESGFIFVEDPQQVRISITLEGSK